MKNYFNTNKEKGQTLLDSDKKASNQESKILSVFERNPLIIEDNPACKDYDFVILVYSGYIE